MRAHRLGTGLAYGSVLLVTLLGLVLVAQDYWRRGVALLGAGMLLGAGLRAVLPARRAGMLVVRSRPVDVAVLGLLGAAALVLVAVIRTTP